MGKQVSLLSAVKMTWKGFNVLSSSSVNHQLLFLPEELYSPFFLSLPFQSSILQATLMSHDNFRARVLHSTVMKWIGAENAEEPF